jgi:hypothetical protein
VLESERIGARGSHCLTMEAGRVAGVGEVDSVLYLAAAIATLLGHRFNDLSVCFV